MPRHIDADKINYHFLRVAGHPVPEMLATEFEINAIPTADVQEIIHARWVDGICTNCGVEKPIVIAYRGFSDIVYQYQGELNYCPNCGAKMDGGGDE